MSPSRAIGAMRERLVIQTNTPPTIGVSSLTRAAALATAVTAAPHGFATNDYVLGVGAAPAGYNGKVKVTVVDPSTFTFPCGAGLSTPATGTITVTYVSDAQGGRRLGWMTLDAIAAEMIPVRADERLQGEAVQGDEIYRFRVRRRSDITKKMRALWTPTWPGAVRLILEITGVLPSDDRQYMFLEAAVSPATA